MGGTDDPSNLIKLSVEEHAKAHKLLYEKYGKIEDKLAWLGLDKMIGQDEKMRELNRMAGLKTVEMKAGIHDPSKKHLKQKGGRKSIQKMASWIKQSVWINNGQSDSRIPKSQISEFIASGWVRGRLCKPVKGMTNLTKNLYWVNKNGKNKRIPEDQVDIFVSQGWSSGMFMKP